NRRERALRGSSCTPRAAPRLPTGRRGARRCARRGAGRRSDGTSVGSGREEEGADRSAARLLVLLGLLRRLELEAQREVGSAFARQLELDVVARPAIAVEMDAVVAGREADDVERARAR